MNVSNLIPFAPVRRTTVIPATLTLLICAALPFNRLNAAPARSVGSSAQTGGAQAVVVEDVPLAHTTQLWPVDRKGALVGKGDVEIQISQVMGNISHALGKAGSKLDHVLKLNVYAANNDVVSAVQKAFAKKFKGAGPAICYVVGNLATPDALVGMDAIATVSGNAPKEVTRLQAMMLPTEKTDAHVAVLPAGGAVYISGQAKDGKDLAESTRLTLQSLTATLEWLKLKKSDAVEFKCFTKPMSDVAVVQKEFRDFFGPDLAPPVSFVEWTQQKPAIEIELIASARDTGAQDSDSITYLTPPGFTASNVYAKVARINHGKKVYLSGLFAQPGTGEAQVKEIFSEMRDITKNAGTDFDHLVKATYYVSDNDASNMLNKLRPNYYNPKRPPAASKALVRGVGLPGRTLTLDMVAVEVEKK